jgi:hypothetical protein
MYAFLSSIVLNLGYIVKGKLNDIQKGGGTGSKRPVIFLVFLIYLSIMGRFPQPSDAFEKQESS